MELSKEDKIIARGIALNAMLLIEEFQGLSEFELGYDEKSVEWVDNGYEDSIHSFFDAVRHLPVSQ